MEELEGEEVMVVVEAMVAEGEMGHLVTMDTAVVQDQEVMAVQVGEVVMEVMVDLEDLQEEEVMVDMLALEACVSFKHRTLNYSC